MEDSRIIELFWNRFGSAIRETEAAYGRYCFGIARNVLEDDSDAEECVSDAYMTLWNTFPPQRPDRLQSYLGRIVRNGALNRRKARSTAKRGGGRYPVAPEELAEALAAKDGELFTVTEAYEQGVLTQEDVAALADMHNNRQYFDARPLYVRSLDSDDTNFRLEKPSEELQKRFVEEYVAYMNTMRPDKDDYFKPSDVAIARWYGSFDDIHFLWISNRKLAHIQSSTADHIYGYVFRYGSGQRIRVWVEGEFITMTEAYQRDILTETW